MPRIAYAVSELTAEDLISEAYSAIVNGDDRDSTWRGSTRSLWCVGLRKDGTTFIY